MAAIVRSPCDAVVTPCPEREVRRGGAKDSQLANHESQWCGQSQGGGSVGGSVGGYTKAGVIPRWLLGTSTLFWGRGQMLQGVDQI